MWVTIVFLKQNVLKSSSISYSFVSAVQKRVAIAFLQDLPTKSLLTTIYDGFFGQKPMFTSDFQQKSPLWTMGSLNNPGVSLMTAAKKVLKLGHHVTCLMIDII